MKIDVPAAVWVPVSFKIINERARLAELDDLKSVVLQKDDLEIRVWGGFGVSMLQGHIIKRTNGQWLAAYVPPAWPKGRDSYLPIHTTPKSGWERFWERLTSNGLLTLPDSTEQMDEYLYSHDGTSYVVEINMNKTYRTYHYRDPHERDFPEAKRMAAIIDILYEELGRVTYENLGKSNLHR